MPTADSIDVNKYVDFNYRGFQSSPSLNQQYPFLVTGVEAIKNVIKMYLMSNRGDYGRNLAKGGPLVSTLGKLMSENTQVSVQNLVQRAIEVYTNIVVNKVEVIPDYAAKTWIVKINFSDTYNKFVDNINLSIVQQG